MKNNSAQVKKSTKPKKRKNSFLRNIQNIKLNNSGKLVPYIIIALLVLSFGAIYFYQNYSIVPNQSSLNQAEGSLTDPRYDPTIPPYPSDKLSLFDLNTVDVSNTVLNTSFPGANWDFFEYGLVPFGKYKDYKIIAGVDITSSKETPDGYNDYNAVFLLTNDMKNFIIISNRKYPNIPNISETLNTDTFEFNPDLYSYDENNSFYGIPYKLPVGEVQAGVLMRDSTIDTSVVKVWNSEVQDSLMKEVGSSLGRTIYFNGSAYYIYYNGIFFKYNYTLYGLYGLANRKLPAEQFISIRPLKFKTYSFLHHNCNFKTGDQFYFNYIPKSELLPLPNNNSLKLYTLKNYSYETIKMYVFPALAVYDYNDKSKINYFQLEPDVVAYGNVDSDSLVSVTSTLFTLSPDTFIFLEDEFGNLLMLHEADTFKPVGGC